MKKKNCFTKILEWLDFPITTKSIAVVEPQASEKEILIALIIDDIRNCPDEWSMTRNLFDTDTEENYEAIINSQFVICKHRNAHYTQNFHKIYINDIIISILEYNCILKVFEERNIHKLINYLVRKKQSNKKIDFHSKKIDFHSKKIDYNNKIDYKTMYYYSY